MQQKDLFNAPAFPPQVAQDSLGRIFAAIPGMTKREFFAIMLLPKCIDINNKTPLALNGKRVTPFEAAVYWADQLFNELNKNEENEKDTLQIIQ